jgi:predicted AAA+ superfamily ATPase
MRESLKQPQMLVIFGYRQSGKTTLAKNFAAVMYFDLKRPADDPFAV